MPEPFKSDIQLTPQQARPGSGTAPADEAAVLVVDDDAAVREALCELLESVGLSARGFGSAIDLLESNLLDRPGCLILDVRMPGLGGLALQAEIAARDSGRPIIFLTGHGDIPMSVQAMKAGAVDFLTKPFRDQTLLDAVNAALSLDRQRRQHILAARRNLDLFTTLTMRERQVLAGVVEGSLNKNIAYDLGISEVTVKLHRASAMRKMCARSVSHLVRAWQLLPAEFREASHVSLA